jgi:beta-aspartyl-peptidase (threonine type)
MSESISSIKLYFLAFLKFKYWYISKLSPSEGVKKTETEEFVLIWHQRKRHGRCHPATGRINRLPSPFFKQENTMSKKFLVQIHGGAWDIPQELIAPHHAGVQAAQKRTFEVLHSGSHPLDAVAEALAVMENDPTFDAGHGSFLNENGEVELDAAVMEGQNLRAGSVACLSSFENPGRIALAVLQKTEHVLLAGSGAEAFALKQGFRKVAPRSLIHPREIAAFERWVAAGKPDAKIFFSKPESQSTAGATPEKRGTVGVVIGVLNSVGKYDLFAGTSTGGTPGKMEGRVGDVPLVGCGFYADNEGAAVSCTGWGEGLARIVAAKSVSDMCAAGMHPQDAIETVLRNMHRRTGGRGGLIAIDYQGRTGVAYSTPEMAYAGENPVAKHITI